MKKCILLFAWLISFQAEGQTNVRAWYADGQVWVVWEVAFPLPEWYAVYAKPTDFSNTNDAVFVGKLHKFEYTCAALKEQIAPSATPRIPPPSGSGKYQLANNEALFVFTPHQAGSLHFAVVAEDAVLVTNGENITNDAVPFQYNPAGDPVECHLQATFPSPFASGFTCFAFLMWADGRQNQWENRPDFPVMANAAKNGMPSLFFLSVPVGLDTTKAFPLSVWLHGGGGTARQSLAGSRAEINIKPQLGILLAHDDNLLGWRNQTPPFPDMPSWHFGWRKNFDPFRPNNLPVATDTIVNYTQRRYLWIDAWLLERFNIDPARIHLFGHSMGSAGATALAKCYPQHYASCTIFNNGFAGPDSDNNAAIFGETVDNLPTNLKNRNGESVRQLHLWNLLDNCSTERDLPLFRHWHSKNDDNGVMHWGPYVVENYRFADSLGIGIQNQWSERSHGVDTGSDYNDHWVNGTQSNQQTVLDNVAFAENYSRSDHSFPAFFNHGLDPQNNDPGIGLLGINQGDGDNWGTWGGYHRWDLNDLNENASFWSVTAWLEADAVFANDNCPVASLTADMAIRRPQQFKPPTGTAIYWRVIDLLEEVVLQSGTATVQSDDLVVIPQVTVFKENVRKIRIELSTNLTASGEVDSIFSKMSISPNPSGSEAILTVFSKKDMRVSLKLGNSSGVVFSIEKQLLHIGENHLGLLKMDSLPAGLYFVEISGGGQRQVVKWVKR